MGTYVCLVGRKRVCGVDIKCSVVGDGTGVAEGAARRISKVRERAESLPCKRRRQFAIVVQPEDEKITFGVEKKTSGWVVHEIKHLTDHRLRRRN